MKMMPAIEAGVFAFGSPAESCGPIAYATAAAIRNRLITGSVDSSQRRRPMMSMDLIMCLAV